MVRASGLLVWRAQLLQHWSVPLQYFFEAGPLARPEVRVVAQTMQWVRVGSLVAVKVLMGLMR